MSVKWTPLGPGLLEEFDLENFSIDKTLDIFEQIYKEKIMREKEDLFRYNMKTYGKTNIAVINMPRGSGKTTSLLRAASSNNGIFVGLSMINLDHAKALCKYYDIKEPLMTTYDKIKEVQGRNPESGLYLDDVEAYLSHKLGRRPVEAISL